MLRRTIYLNQPTLNQLAVDTQVQSKFGTGPVRHTLLSGFDYQNNEITGRTGVGGFAAPINVFNPVYGNYRGANVRRDLAPAKQIQTGAYLQDQIEWNKWLLMLGLRYDLVARSAGQHAGGFA